MTKSINEGVQDLLRYLLVSKKVKAVFALRTINDSGAVAYSLIADPKELKDAVPLHPFMPANAGQLLSFYTLNGASSEPIAVVMRPCELRAFIELVKRKKGNFENLIVISSTCAGVFPLKLIMDGNINQKISEYIDEVEQGKVPNNIRRICKSCENFFPVKYVDIILTTIGKNITSESNFIINSDKASTIIEGIDSSDSSLDSSGISIEDIGDQGLRQEYSNEVIDRQKSSRNKEKMSLFSEIDEKGLELGLKGLVNIFGRCIGCKACRAACPLCYCQLCNFDTQNSKYTLNNYELDRKKGFRIPPNTIYFHLLRLSHMGISCVGCGSCEEVCPVDIPISTIFKKVGESIQDMFEYLPGNDIEEEVPIKTFELDELTEVED
jgi:formate dehydrogenase subunit beta